MEFRLKL